METNDKSVVDALIGTLTGETKPEILVTTRVEMENATLFKIAVVGTIISALAIMFGQWMLRLTLRRFFKTLA